ncbi:MAG: acetyl-CoA carboxylase biotin carboxylase subunit [Ardenticatenaceae bacterium]|nr:acetyl-CoA carboxylase biotin carboxylase subunit [Ardenticatenaceae bacterium]
MMNKILVANRGEIAVRIMRTAQALGYETVAVFSEADAAAPHVSLADQAVYLGPAEVDQSYLNIERVLAAAKKSGADALHPGYGFLSENSGFARKVLEAGLTWIGPPPEAMEIMGNKAAAKRALIAAGVPCVPGYDGQDQSDEAFIRAADEIDFPVMVKAAAGGGGRGMRLVSKREALPAALASARSEAHKAFGSAELLLERAVVNPRHVEVQVFGDTHGRVIHLGERDCSIQRRHQKVVEEAPSPAVSDDLRQRMGQAAVAAAKAVGYVNAGTVEFLLDDTGAFFFIEMNTRLQVEHPVTEMVTGQDLVAWQLLVAEGHPLPLTQEAVKLHGHAIEVRLYAEDPDQQFMPSTGLVHHWRPFAGEGIRVDHGLAAGTEITPFYDPMAAKIIAWGESREIARRRLRRALRKTAVFGVQTNRRFLLEITALPLFIQGPITTNFIAQTWPSENDPQPSADLTAAAALLIFRQNLGENEHGIDHWQTRPFACRFGENVVTVKVHEDDQYRVQVENKAPLTFRCINQTADTIRLECDGVQKTIDYAFGPDQTLWLQDELFTAVFQDNLLAPPILEESAGSGNIVAPMPGAVMRLEAAVGDTVSKGQTLLILEAMKIEHPIPAPFDGLVAEILIEPGQQMKVRELMMVMKKLE